MINVTITIERRMVRGPVYFPVAPDYVAVIWDSLGLRLTETRRKDSASAALKAARAIAKRRGWHETVWTSGKLTEVTH